MLKLSIATTLIALATLAGCSQGKPGGPGSKSPAPTFGQAADTFNLSVPLRTSWLQQGAQLDATIGIQRAKNFNEDVTLNIADLPRGITIDPPNPVIKRGDSNAKVTFKASDEAAIGGFDLIVTGHPTNGGDAQVEFKLRITAKDSFTLSVPQLSTPLKQGETQNLTIGIQRGKTFDEDVSLAFGELPTGVTIEPAAPVIKRGENETQIKLMGTNDAALGNFAVKVTGHPVKGADAANQFNLTVSKD